MRIRLFFLSLVLAALLLSFLWRQPVEQLLAPRGDALRAEPPPAARSQSFVMTGMDLQQTQGGRKELRLTARRVFSENQEQLLELEDVRTAFFDADGGVTYTVTGDKGVYQPREERITVSGDVVVTGRGDLEVRTDSIRYAARTSTFETDAAATLLGRGITAQGAGLRYDTRAGLLRMGGAGGRVSTSFRAARR